MARTIETVTTPTMTITTGPSTEALATNPGILAVMTDGRTIPMRERVLGTAPKAQGETGLMEEVDAVLIGTSIVG